MNPIVVFDLDGTLADTAPDLMATLNTLLAQEGLPTLPVSRAKSLIGAGARALIARGYESAGLELTPERHELLFQEFLTLYRQNICNETQLFPGVVAAMDSLSGSGFTLAVCTNKVESHSRLLLDQLGINRTLRRHLRARHLRLLQARSAPSDGDYRNGEGRCAPRGDDRRFAYRHRHRTIRTDPRHCRALRLYRPAPWRHTAPTASSPISTPCRMPSMRCCPGARDSSARIRPAQTLYWESSRLPGATLPLREHPLSDTPQATTNPKAHFTAPDARDFAHVDTWIFDLDNTLYSHEARIWPQVDARITAFVADLFGIDGMSARALQKYFYHQHGTTLKALMDVYGVDPYAFLDFAHDIDHSAIDLNPALGKAIEALPGRRLILTNGSRKHAENVAAKIGILDHFEDVFDIVAADFIPKPDRRAYEMFFERHAVDPARAAMFEDIAKKPRRAPRDRHDHHPRHPGHDRPFPRGFRAGSGRGPPISISSPAISPNFSNLRFCGVWQGR